MRRGWRGFGALSSGYNTINICTGAGAGSWGLLSTGLRQDKCWPAATFYLPVPPTNVSWKPFNQSPPQNSRQRNHRHTEQTSHRGQWGGGKISPLTSLPPPSPLLLPPPSLRGLIWFQLSPCFCFYQRQTERTSWLMASSLIPHWSIVLAGCW